MWSLSTTFLVLRSTGLVYLRRYLAKPSVILHFELQKILEDHLNYMEGLNSIASTLLMPLQQSLINKNISIIQKELTSQAQQLMPRLVSLKVHNYYLKNR